MHLSLQKSALSQALLISIPLLHVLSCNTGHIFQIHLSAYLSGISKSSANMNQNIQAANNHNFTANPDRPLSSQAHLNLHCWTGIVGADSDFRGCCCDV